MKLDIRTTPEANGPFTLFPLPFAHTALAPIISARTLRLHHGKHHKGYVDKLNALVMQRGMQELSVVDLIRRTHGSREQKEIFNNAAQAWNHDFYWQSLTPPGGKATERMRSGELARLIDESFGSIQALKTELVKSATARFGSGWAWLVRDGSRLKVMSTSNAEVPFTAGPTPLLTLDVWEHAYYLDYQNRRDEHVAAVVDQLLNWTFAAENLARTKDFGSDAPSRVVV
jgi:Fe-Mn family superoxide dismutase